MNRFWRKIMASLGVCALLFAQLAVAAYACPTSGSGVSAIAKIASNDEVKPCHNMDPVRANLCKQHCEQTSQSVDTNLHTTIDAPLLPLLTTIISPAIHLPVRATWRGESLARSIDPPLSIRNCRFLI
ncbi:MAG: hypothetical protein V4568_00395 [Pseudomonadota bacterium]